MGGGRFAWVKPEVYPIIVPITGAVLFSCYSMFRQLYTNPDVHVNKDVRMEGVPESGITDQRASGYKSSIYRSLGGVKEKPRIFG